MRASFYIIFGLAGLGVALIVGGPGCSSVSTLSLPNCDDAGRCPVNSGCVYAGCGPGAPTSCRCGFFPDWRGCCPDGLVIQFDALSPRRLDLLSPPACVPRCLQPPCSQCIDAGAPFAVTIPTVQPCVMDAGDTEAGACASGTVCYGYGSQRQYCWPLPDSQGCCADGLVIAPEFSSGAFVCMTPAQLMFQYAPGYCYSSNACQRCIDGGT